jgi:hypothetical protein
MSQYFELRTNINNNSQELLKQAAMGDTSLDSYLERIGVAADVIEFVNTITDMRLKQQLIGYLRQLPQTSKESLIEQATSQVKQPEQQPNTTQEINLARRFENAEFQRWLLVNLRKARYAYDKFRKQNNMDLTGDGYNMFRRGNVNFTIITDVAQSIYDWYIRGVLPARRAFATARTPEEKAAVVNEYGVTNANTNLASLDLEQADNFSDNWHKVIAGGGEGIEYYGEKQDNIVYGPQWKNEKFNGWTIKQILTKNNALAEGNKMGHCVGSYRDDLVSGKLRVFSLRDPSNNPHVTMEVARNSWDFEQIRGNGPKTGNAEPSQNLKQMIGEWLKTLKHVRLQDESFDYERCDYRDLEETLFETIYRGNDYGIEDDLTNWDFPEAYEYVAKALQGGSRGGYDNNGGYQTQYVAKILAKAAVDADTQNVERGIIDENRIITAAYNLAMISRKHIMMLKDTFDYMSIENRKAYVKDYIKQAEEMFKNRQPKNIQHKLTNFRDYTDPSKRESTILSFAYEAMSYAKQFDENDIKSFHDLNKNDQQKFLAKAIDKYFNIAHFYDIEQENNEKFYQSFLEDDDNYDPFPPPNEYDYDSDKKYKAAYQKWEEEVQQKRDEAADEYRNNNLPWCLDSMIAENIQEILMQKKFKLPKWFSKYFKGTGHNQNYPQIMWALDMAKKNKNKRAKEKKQAKASGWYNSCKMSNNI